MIPFRRILFPVDYSEPCREMVPYVKDMVAKFSAELIVLKAFEFPPLGLIDMGYGNVPTAPIISSTDIQKADEKRMDEFVAANLSGVKLRKVFKEGDAAQAIDAAVQHEGIDLVMLPTRGQGAFRRMLLGSVTAKVLHDANCAIWTDTHAELADHKPGIPYKSVVCAIGFSDESRAILHGAAAIAKEYGAKLHIVHSVETPPAAYEVDFGPFRDELMAGAEAELQKLRAEANVEATIWVGSGAVADVVRDEAKKQKADLVVTGRGHSQGALSRVWSSLYSIVREAPCPVLSI